MSTTKEEPKEKAPEYTPDHPEFPKLMYHQKSGKTAPAKDKDDEAKLAKQGYSENPPAPEDTDSWTKEDQEQLDALDKKKKKAEHDFTTQGSAEPAKPATAPPPKK